MTHAALDYRFAWRCLLPAAAVANAGLRLFGFTDDEAQFWRHWCAHQTGPVLGTVGALAPEQAQAASLLLVDAERCPASAWPTAAELAQAAVVAVVADRAQGRLWRRALGAAFPAVSEFALLPAAQPRVVVPLSAPGHALAGLGLHRPGRWVARAGVSLARALAAHGHYGLLRGRVLLIAARSPQVPAAGALQAGLNSAPDGQPWQAFALYLGTPDDKRKTVVLPIGKTATSIILKIADTPKTHALLQNEALALKLLSHSTLSNSVPSYKGLISSGSSLTLYQEYRKRPLKFGPDQSMDSIICFLAELSLIGRKSRVIGGISVTGHFCHGDFAPWNLQVDRSGIFVFDWEHSTQWAPAFADAFYFIVAPAVLIQKESNLSAIEGRAKLFAKQLAGASGFNDAKIDQYWELWLPQAIKRIPQIAYLLKKNYG